MGKRENAGYQHFFLFQQCFHWLLFEDHLHSDFRVGQKMNAGKANDLSLSSAVGLIFLSVFRKGTPCHKINQDIGENEFD